MDAYKNAPLDTEGSRGHAQEQSVVPRSLAPVDRTYRHRGSSATPASLYRERTIYTG